MMVLVTYDVNTQSAFGRKRLRKVAKECLNYGIRVQNSVFECNVDNYIYKKLKNELLDIIDEDEDSLRFYIIGDKYKNSIEHYGVENGVDVEGALIL
ncbi:CRISPR-associated endonuclease Cas2 [Catenisphaera adipataccumulans]|uniref:CRISPR-associated endoribonuclease Cas2 n=1 Tax=Catenisphaera adipataccumulans TaxID=700500 RepID=A0A7W8CYK9_9FIRM|nr:CRISPR-associated endonuclease Cas2 [Catenisphaera adipataccumulans]MBB5183951.1 CRISPR-associated protein Cas2 [Catenisphaera adipataccumulans]